MNQLGHSESRKISSRISSKKSHLDHKNKNSDDQIKKSMDDYDA